MSNDWIEHDGGPQPVGDDVWVHVQWADLEGGYPSRVPDEMEQASELPWEGNNLRYRILNQHLIDAARLEGIRLGLDAAADKLAEWQDRDLSEILHIDPDTIAKEAHRD